jgi:hypothetical protein
VHFPAKFVFLLQTCIVQSLLSVKDLIILIGYVMGLMAILILKIMLCDRVVITRQCS